MNVLMISWDPSAAMEKGYIGDLPDRLVEYGKHLSKLFVITYSAKSMGLKERKLSKNVFVFPTSCHSKLFFALTGYKIAAQIFKRERIDLITTQDPYLTGLLGYLLKKKYGAPLVIQIHSETLDNKFWLNERKINHLFNILGKFLLKRADAVRVDSSRIKAYSRKKLHIPSSKIFTIPVFTKMDRFLRCNRRVLLKLKKRFAGYNRIVLYVGRLSDEKNVENLLKAAQIVLKKFPTIVFLIVGHGKEKARLMKLSSDLGLDKNMKFEGYVQDVVTYYHSCDIFVLPSNYEGRPIALVEALACAKPVVATDVSGVRDVVIEGKSGYIVPLNNPAALAKGIMRLLEQPEKMVEMGKTGQSYVLHAHDIKKNSYKLREMYEKVIDRHKVI
jgi:glycosyltransferase involved in cell wall biosynthesis